MYAAIKKVKATNDHKLVIDFNNNERRLFDITPYLNIGRFVELKNIDMFKTVRVSFDTIEWENGLDIDPEFLYAKSERI